jgi:hypothetical protein
VSYIRNGQEGSYVDIPKGSIEYIYDNGEKIGRWDYGEFASVVGSLADELDISEEEAISIKAGFRRHFEGWQPDASGDIPAPEKAEIFCQCVDSRIESLVLTDELHDAVKDWLSEKKVVFPCEVCGTKLRPVVKNGEPYRCDDCIEPRDDGWEI